MVLPGTCPATRSAQPGRCTSLTVLQPQTLSLARVPVLTWMLNADPTEDHAKQAKTAPFVQPIGGSKHANDSKKMPAVGIQSQAHAIQWLYQPQHKDYLLHIHSQQNEYSAKLASFAGPAAIYEEFTRLLQMDCLAYAAPEDSGMS